MLFNSSIVGPISEIQPHEQQAGQLADAFAQLHVFDDYMDRKAESTLDAHRTDLRTFCDFLATIGIERQAHAMQTTPAPWSAMTHGMVSAFVRWLLREGYSVSTVNRKLSTVKVYAGLAARAGAIDAEAYAMIRMVRAYTDTEARRIDERRPQRRVSAEKSKTTSITSADAAALKLASDDTPAGRRNTLIFCLLLDHGLRVSELIGLRCNDFDLARGTFTVYRQKVDLTQTHRMTRQTTAALGTAIDAGDIAADSDAYLLRKSRKDGSLTSPGISRQSVFRLVRSVGEANGIDSLSPHDLRHFWATHAVSLGTSAFALRDAGGWKSLAMPSRYVEQSEIANDGVLIQ